MRKWNNILVHIIIALFMIHGLMGSLMLLGVSNISCAPLSWLLFILVVIHCVLGMCATFRSLKSGKVSGTWYLGKNSAFWAKRVSGIAILVLLVFHITAYTVRVDGRFFLREFTLWRMISQLLLIGSIFVHLGVSVKSMLIARGTIKWKEKTVDWLLVLSIMMLFFTVAVIGYFIQWQR